MSFRLNNERSFDSYVAVLDGDCIYKDIPDDYVFPTNKKLPYFANLYPDGTYFGYVGGSALPRNRVCIEHYNKDEEEDKNAEESED